MARGPTGQLLLLLFLKPSVAYNPEGWHKLDRYKISWNVIIIMQETVMPRFLQTTNRKS